MSPELILGNSRPLCAALLLFCICGCAALVGATMAREWRPARHVFPIGVVMGIVDRALGYALFQADLLSPAGFAVDTYCILLAAALAWRYTLAVQLVRQYPWMYRRSLLLGWRRLRPN